MTTKDFTGIAGLLVETEASYDTCALFADWFAARYPRFDRDRFMRACNY